jgi:hypothetical protein
MGINWKVLLLPLSVFMLISGLVFADCGSTTNYTWTTQSDFQAQTLMNNDTITVPGELRLNYSQFYSNINRTTIPGIGIDTGGSNPVTWVDLDTVNNRVLMAGGSGLTSAFMYWDLNTNTTWRINFSGVYNITYNLIGNLSSPTPCIPGTSVVHVAYDRVSNNTYVSISSGVSPSVGLTVIEGNTSTSYTYSSSGVWNTTLGNYHSYKTINALAFDSTDNLIYLAAGGIGSLGAGKFGVYNRTDNTTYDLSATDLSDWISNSNVNALAFDSTNNLVYIGANSGKFGVYNRTDGITYDLSATDTSPANWISTNNINALAYDPTHNLVYFGGAGGRFGVYDRINNTAYNLTNAVIGTNVIYSLAFDSTNNLVYIGAVNGKFGVYNPVTNTTSDLSTTDPGDWIGTSTTLSRINALTFDSTNNLVYIGAASGKFGVYNRTDNTAYDLRLTVLGNWTKNYNITSLAFDSTNTLVYLGANNGTFGVYNRTDNTAYDLSTTTPNNWLGLLSPITIKALSFNSVGNMLYLGGDYAEFGVYNRTSNITSDLRGTAANAWLGASQISSTPTINEDAATFSLTNGTHLFVGTSTKGLTIIELATNTSVTYNTTGKYNTTNITRTLISSSPVLPNNYVRSLYLDNDKHLLFIAMKGTTIFTGGFSILNLTSDTITSYLFSTPIAILSNSVFYAWYDNSTNRAYVNTYNGTSVIDLATNIIIINYTGSSSPPGTPNVPFNHTYSWLDTATNILYIAQDGSSATAGMVAVNLNTNTSTNYYNLSASGPCLSSCNKVWAMKKDVRTGLLYLGMQAQGLFTINTTYNSTATMSNITDVGTNTTQRSISWSQSLSTGSNITVSVREGDTSPPTGSWTSFSSVSDFASFVFNSSGNYQYIQWLVNLSTTNTTATPSLKEFNVSIASACPCGSNITTDTTLTADITGCTENGLNITADNIVLDCNGHTISGTGVGSGIYATRSGANAYTNLTVKNCTISNFAYDIYASGADNLAGNAYNGGNVNVTNSNLTSINSTGASTPTVGGKGGNITVTNSNVSVVSAYGGMCTTAYSGSGGNGGNVTAINSKITTIDNYGGVGDTSGAGGALIITGSTITTASNNGGGGATAPGYGGSSIISNSNITTINSYTGNYGGGGSAAVAGSLDINDSNIDTINTYGGNTGGRAGWGGSVTARNSIISVINAYGGKSTGPEAGYGGNVLLINSSSSYIDTHGGNNSDISGTARDGGNITIVNSALNLSNITINASLGFGSTPGSPGILKLNNSEIYTSDGKIKFSYVQTNQTNLTNIMSISNNLITLNSATYPDYNVSANLTLNGAGTFSNPVILRNGAVCNSTTSPSCYNFTALSGITAVFNVSGFTSYSIGEAPSPPPTCGQSDTAGIISYWRGESDTNDSKDNNPGTAYGGMNYVAGKVGNAFNFDGVDDYIGMPLSSSLNLTNDMTVEAWVKPIGTFYGLVVMSKYGFSEYNASAGDYFVNRTFWLGLDYDSGNYYIDMWVQNSSQVHNGCDSSMCPIQIPGGEWTHLAYVYDTSSRRFLAYVNGNLRINITGGSDIAEYPVPIEIGRSVRWNSSLGYGYYFEGPIDEVAIYNRALSQSEIQQHCTRSSSGDAYCTKSLACGDTITSDTNLTEDLTCSGTALNIGADNLTIDCAGHTISGDGTGYGINATTAADGYNITVKNCAISNFSVDINAPGIDGYNGGNITLMNSNLTLINAYGGYDGNGGSALVINSTVTTLQTYSGLGTTNGAYAGTVEVYNSSITTINAYARSRANNGAAGAFVRIVNSNITTISNNGGGGSSGSGGNGGDVNVTSSNINSITSSGGSGNFNPGYSGTVTFISSNVSNISCKGGGTSHGSGRVGGNIVLINSTLDNLGNSAIDITGGDGPSHGANGTITLNNTELKNQFGSIKYNYVQSQNAAFTSIMSISSNLITLDSATYPDYNVSANLTLNGVGSFSNPAILRNGVECNSTTSPSCYNFTSLNAGTVIFNVSGFTNYSIGENIVTDVNISSCQDLNLSSVTYHLNQNVSSSGTCFNIIANNITLDCHNFNITKTSSGSTISISGNLSRIINCNILDTGSANGGIGISSSYGDSLENISIYLTGNPSTGISLFSSSNNTFNNISSRVTGCGIRFQSSNNNNLTNSVLKGGGGGGDFCSFSSSSGNSISNTTLNYTSYSSVVSFTYSGDIVVSAANAIADSNNLKNIGKYVSITKYSAANVLLNISYSALDIPAGVDANRLLTYKYNGTDWILANTTSSLNGVDTVNRVIYSNLSEFSVFAPLASIASCGSNITTDTTLTANLTCSGTALNIGADNLTIDCNGYTISGDGTGYGINATSPDANAYTNLMIKNCTILNFTASINANGADKPSGNGYNGGNITVENSNVLSISSNGGNGKTNPPPAGIGGSGGRITLINSNATTITAYGGNGTNFGGNAGIVNATSSKITGIYTYSGSASNCLSGGNIYLQYSDVSHIDARVGNCGGGGVNIGGNVTAINSRFNLSSISLNLAGFSGGVSGILTLNNSELYNSNGAINFSYVSTNQTDFSSIMSISSNLITVDSATYNDYNVSANLTLYSVPVFSNPVILRNGAVCNSTTTPSCYNFTALNAATVIFNVSGFTNYSIGEKPLECGDTITSDTNLTADLTGCTGTGLTIGADNVILDCKGHSITGSNTVSGVSIERDSVTVKNCNITNFLYGISLIANTKNNIISNCNASGSNCGIYIYSSSNNTIINSNASATYGIYLTALSHNNTILNSIATGSNYGIYIHSSHGTPNNNTLKNNTLSGTITNLYLAAASNVNLVNQPIGDYVFNAAQYLSFKNTSAGEIAFLQSITSSGSNLDSIISINDNLVYVDSVSYPAFNVSANLTLYGTDSLGLTNKYPYRNGAMCDPGICTELQDADTYIFNVTGFTNYSVGETDVPPIVNLQSPDDLATISAINSVANITFIFNYTDALSSTANCTLHINGGNNGTNASVANNTATSITVTNIPAGSYSWNVTCIDNGGLQNSSSNRTFTVYNTTIYVSACQNLTYSGALYYLQNNITTLGTCINVTANNVTFDCQGHSITGGGSNYGVVIDLHDSVTIKNCNVLNFSQGIRLTSDTNSIISNCNASGSASGIFIGYSEGNTINVTILNSNASSSAGDGISFSGSGSYNNTILNSIATGNYGIRLYNSHGHPGNTTLKNNTLSGATASLSLDSINVGSTNLVDQPVGSYVFNNVQNLILENSSAGNISFLQSITQTGTNLGSDIQITNNLVSVDSAGHSGLNVSANLTLYNPSPAGFPPYKVVRDGVECNSTTTPSCYNFTALNAATVIFNVSGFTNYSIMGFGVSGSSNVIAPPGVFEPYNASLSGTHVNTFGIKFVDLNMHSDETLTCTIKQSNGTLFNISATGLSVVSTNYTLNYTITSGDSIINDPVAGYIPWELKNCTLTNASGTIFNQTINNRIYVHAPAYWSDSEVTRAVTCQGTPGVYFNNTAKCNFGGDTVFALQMRNGNSVEPSCFNNPGVGCSNSYCTGIYFPSCTAPSYFYGYSATSDDPNGYSSFTASFSGYNTPVAYTQYVNSSGTFKLRVTQALTAKPFSFTIYNLTNASNIAGATNVYGPNTGAGTLRVTDQGDGTWSVAYYKFSSFTGTLDFTFNISFTNTSLVQNRSVYLVIAYGTDTNQGSPPHFNVNFSPMLGLKNANESENTSITTESGGTCGDGVNNDFDYLGAGGSWANSYDCYDPDCNNFLGDYSQTNEFGGGHTGLCNYQTERNCTDQFDNNYNGLTDCHDTDCFHNSSAGCPVTETICNDSVNNDYDYTDTSLLIEHNGSIYGFFGTTPLTDCKDPDCNGLQGGNASQFCAWGYETNCSDGFNNDALQLKDCELSAVADATTVPSVANAEYDCAVYCRANVQATETGILCDNNKDDDFDAVVVAGYYSGSANNTIGAGTDCRWIDYNPDEDCDMTTLNSGKRCELGRELTCNDTFDNDFDSYAPSSARPNPGWNSSYYLATFNLAYTANVDYADYDCHGASGSIINESQNASWCFDGVDNDLDAYYRIGNVWIMNASTGTDCNDPDCLGVVNPSNPAHTCMKYEYNATDSFFTSLPNPGFYCNNSIDDDTDNWRGWPNGGTDCRDPDCNKKFDLCAGPCYNVEAVTWNSCKDIIDNDYDMPTSMIDCADSDCAGMIGASSGAFCQATETVCNDNFDNNVNGLVDCADHSSCDSLQGGTVNGTAVYCRASESSSADCFDGFDNDADGEADCYDLGCNAACTLSTITGTSPITLPQWTGTTSINSVSNAFIRSYTNKVKKGDWYNITFTDTAASTNAQWTLGTASGARFNKTAFNVSTASLSGVSSGNFTLTTNDNGFIISSNGNSMPSGYNVTFAIKSTSTLALSTYELTYIEESGAKISLNTSIYHEVVEDTPPTAQSIQVIPNSTGVPSGGTVYMRANISDDTALGLCSWNVTGPGGASFIPGDNTQCRGAFSPTVEGDYNITVTPKDFYSNTGTPLMKAYTLNILPTASSIQINRTVPFYNQSAGETVTINATFNVPSNDSLGTCQVIVRSDTNVEIPLESFAAVGSSCNNSNVDISSLADGKYRVFVRVTETTDSNVVDSGSTALFVCSNVSSGACKFADYNSDGKADFCNTSAFFCGNGVIDTAYGEECDPGPPLQLAGESCPSRITGYGGTLGCNSTCKFDTGGCGPISSQDLPISVSAIAGCDGENINLTVTSTGSPVSGVNIRVSKAGTYLGYIDTGGNGKAAYASLLGESGAYIFEATKTGYIPASTSASVTLCPRVLSCTTQSKLLCSRTGSCRVKVYLTLTGTLQMSTAANMSISRLSGIINPESISIADRNGNSLSSTKDADIVRISSVPMEGFVLDATTNISTAVKQQSSDNLTISIANTGSDVQVGGLGESTGSGTNADTAIPDLSFNITDPLWFDKTVYRVYYTPDGGAQTQVGFTYTNFVVKITSPVTLKHALSSNEVFVDFTPPPPSCSPEGNTTSCYTGPGGTQNNLPCHSGTQTCSGGVWGGCSGQVTPAPTDTCGNGIDDNCNGLVDETCTSCTPGQARSCYSGPGGTQNNLPCHNGTQTCPQSGNWSLEYPACIGQATPASTDTCGNGIDDNCNGVIDEPTGQPDACGNELDDNCNGQIDEGCVFCVQGQTRWCYTGPDGTVGVGECKNGTQTCPVGVGYWSSTWPPCNGQLVPSADTCGDHLDNNCNGWADEGCACVPYTVIQCGPANVGECHKGNQTCGSDGIWNQTCVNASYPASEVCNSKDDNCNGAIDDGLGNVSCGTGACYRSVVACSGGVLQTCTPGQPAANETCGNGIDDNCDGVTDEGCGCVPVNETCNGIDDNCDTLIDNGITLMDCSMYKGICKVGTQSCQNGTWVGCPFARNETCNGLDDNCDGTVDEGCPCISGQNYTCGPANNTGECKLGNSACLNGVLDNCTGEVYPKDEVCNSLDDDCNGVADDGMAPVNCNLSKFGICAIGFESCSNGTLVGCPPQEVETCNGLDDDCDSIKDNGCPCVSGNTQSCGPATQAGICKKGINTCINGSWSVTCIGAVLPEKEMCGNGVDEDCSGADLPCSGCRSGAECDSGKCVNGNCLSVTFSERQVAPGFIRNETQPVTDLIPASVLTRFGIATEVKVKTCDIGTRCSTSDDCFDSQCIDGTCACCVQTCVRSADCCAGYCDQGRCKLPPSMAPFIIRNPDSGSLLSGCAGLIQECLPGEQGCISICNAMTFLLAIVGAGTMFAFWKTYKHPAIAIGSLAIPIVLSIITYPFVGVIISLLMIGMLFAK